MRNATYYFPHKLLHFEVKEWLSARGIDFTRMRVELQARRYGRWTYYGYAAEAQGGEQHERIKPGANPFK